MSIIDIFDTNNELKSESDWKQGALLEISIADLSDTGDGVGRWQERVIFVPETVPGDIAIVRLVHVKPKFAHATLKQILQPSLHRIRPSCIFADKCGGCQWQHINYYFQLEAKRNQVIQALERIGGFVDPPVNNVLPSTSELGYRNKVALPVGTSATGQLIAGYYQKASHQIINLNQCPIQDSRLNPILREIKEDIQKRGWSAYDEQSHTGLIRHIALRIGRRTGEILLTLVTKDWNIPDITLQAQEWLDRYPPLVGVMLNQNGSRTNVIFGTKTKCVAGRPYLREKFAGLDFQVRPETFFQVNTETTEELLQEIQSVLNLQGDEILVDAYCGIGTLTLPLAKQARQAIGIEVQKEAVEQAKFNAQQNSITNVNFIAGKVETLLPNMDISPDIVLLDPPRKGCEANVIEALRIAKPPRIVYVSCKVATLARDLKAICQDGLYTLTRIQPADFFPQTAHVEVAAFLVLSQ